MPKPNPTKTNIKEKKTAKKESKCKLTEIVFILDKSGSMFGKEKDTIGGFNSFIEKQKQEDCKTLVTTVLFCHTYKVIHDRVDIREIQPLTEKDYYTEGCTALLDAVGNTIRNIKTIQSHLRKQDKPDKTMFVITTDGLENSSREYSYSKVKELITEMQVKHDWIFLFLADNLDAAKYAENIGIDKRFTANYDTNTETRMAYDVMCYYSAADVSPKMACSKVLYKEMNSKRKSKDEIDKDSK